MSLRSWTVWLAPAVAAALIAASAAFWGWDHGGAALPVSNRLAPEIPGGAQSEPSPSTSVAEVAGPSTVVGSEDGGQLPVPPVTAATATLSEKAAAEVERIKKANFGSRVLPQELAALARRGDEAGVEALLALSAERFKEEEVLVALGGTKNPRMRLRVAEHLRERILKGEAPAVCAALKSYGRLTGDSVPVLHGAIAANWGRVDGHAEEICRSAVEGLANVNTAESRSALVAELDRVAEPGWLPDYGSTVLAALARGKLTPEVRAAVTGYADRLLALKMPAPDNPIGRKYIEEKVAEVRAITAGENGQTMSKKVGGAHDENL